MRGRFVLSMRTGLRIASLFLALVAVVLWLFGGPNMGWTKTSEMVKTVDPVTDQEIVAWEKRFLPGVDFLAGGLAGAGILFGASFVFRRM
jgi:hypothetical protein